MFVFWKTFAYDTSSLPCHMLYAVVGKSYVIGGANGFLPETIVSQLIFGGG